MTRSDDPRDPTRSEEPLQALFDDTAAPLSTDAARRLEAVARGIPQDAVRRRGPLFGWLAAATAVAGIALVSVIIWGDGGPPPTRPNAPVIAMSEDVRADLAPDAPAPIATLAEEQSEAWEQGYGPFADDDEAPSLVGSVSLAHGLEDPAELELWVQAADEILAETDEI